MINFSKYKVILWDFDGVVMDSMAVREQGFEKALSDYPRNEVSKLLIYHRRNGGLSRYAKFRYFFEHIRKEFISKKKITELAASFSEVMKNELMKQELLIAETVSFIRQYHKNFSMHLVSGSDENELRFLCKHLKIDIYFISIHGSPVPKKELVKNIIAQYDYNSSELALIGDSINDFEAAVLYGIDFYGYNNVALNTMGAGYIKNFNIITLNPLNDVSQ